MCVICIAAGDRRPSDDHVRAMWDTNGDGGGFAWREESGNGKNRRTLVHWEKGIENLNDMIDAAKKLPLPYVLHFRISTCGGAIKALTHPFGVDEHASIALSGSTDRGVLFHNGHFNRWKEAVREYAIATGSKLPGGAWSDSRAMAWLTYHLGDGMVEFFEEKLVLFTPTNIQLGNANSFQREDGLMVSNLAWKHKLRSSSMFTTPPRSMAGGSGNRTTQTDSDKDKEDHSPASCVDPGFVMDRTRLLTTGSMGHSSGTEGGSRNPSPFVKPSLPGSGPLKHRIPETGELCSKNALKRWKRSISAQAARGDMAARGWENFIERFPQSTINPDYWPLIWDNRTVMKPTTKPSRG